MVAAEMKEEFLPPVWWDFEGGQGLASHILDEEMLVLVERSLPGELQNTFQVGGTKKQHPKRRGLMTP